MQASDFVSLRHSALFAGLPRRELTAVLKPCFAQDLPAGTLLCQQGETARFLHVMVSGRVGLFAKGPYGETLIEIFGPGDAFIVPAVLLEAPYLVSARLLDSGRVLMWPAAAFRADIAKNTALALGAARQLAGYWRLLIGQIKDLKLLTASERLAAFLVSLAPRRKRQGALTVELPGGRTLVASLLGLAPQSLSRAFAELRPIGVSGGGRTIAIADIARLAAIGGTNAGRES